MGNPPECDAPGGILQGQFSSRKSSANLSADMRPGTSNQPSALEVANRSETVTGKFPHGQFLPGQFLPRKKNLTRTFHPKTVPTRSLQLRRPHQIAHTIFLYYGVSPNLTCKCSFFKPSWLQRNTFNICLVFWVYIHRYTMRAGR